jgi:hypothetical protein
MNIEPPRSGESLKTEAVRCAETTELLPGRTASHSDLRDHLVCPIIPLCGLHTEANSPFLYSAFASRYYSLLLSIGVWSPFCARAGRVVIPFGSRIGNVPEREEGRKEGRKEGRRGE